MIKGSKKGDPRKPFTAMAITCLICKLEFPLDNFHRDSGAPSGRRPYCKPCNSAKTLAHRRANAMHFKNQFYRQKYGISLEEKINLVGAAGGKCESCGSSSNGKPKADPVLGWCVDHDHATDKYRGILCLHCNAALGMLFDSEERIIALLNYLRSKKG